MCDLGRNTTTLNEFIWCTDLIDFHQISLKHPRNNDNRKCVGKFWYLKYLSCGVHLHNVLHIFRYANFRCWYLLNQSEYRKSTSLTYVDRCLVNVTVQPFCSCISIRYLMNSIEELSVALCLTGFCHFLKGRLLKLYFFIVICIYQAFFWYIVCYDFG